MFESHLVSRNAATYCYYVTAEAKDSNFFAPSLGVTIRIYFPSQDLSQRKTFSLLLNLLSDRIMGYRLGKAVFNTDIGCV